MGNADLWVKIDDKVIHARRYIPETECLDCPYSKNGKYCREFTSTRECKKHPKEKHIEDILRIIKECEEREKEGSEA
ncbi:MAG: hypothetical protein AB1523_06160 [Bacillota bacterium]